MQAKKERDFEVLRPGLQGNNNKATSKAVQDTALYYTIQKPYVNRAAQCFKCGGW